MLTTYFLPNFNPQQFLIHCIPECWRNTPFRILLHIRYTVLIQQSLPYQIALINKTPVLINSLLLRPNVQLIVFLSQLLYGLHIYMHFKCAPQLRDVLIVISALNL